MPPLLVEACLWYYPLGMLPLTRVCPDDRERCAAHEACRAHTPNGLQYMQAKLVGWAGTQQHDMASLQPQGTCQAGLSCPAICNYNLCMRLKRPNPPTVRGKAGMRGHVDHV